MTPPPKPVKKPIDPDGFLKLQSAKGQKQPPVRKMKYCTLIRKEKTLFVRTMTLTRLRKTFWLRGG